MRGSPSDLYLPDITSWVQRGPISVGVWVLRPSYPELHSFLSAYSSSTDMFIDFRERGRERNINVRNINCCLLYVSQLGCQTHNLLVYGMTLQSTESPGQCTTFIFTDQIPPELRPFSSSTSLLYNNDRSSLTQNPELCSTSVPLRALAYSLTNS